MCVLGVGSSTEFNLFMRAFKGYIEPSQECVDI